jgi:hypothetical protein
VRGLGQEVASITLSFLPDCTSPQALRKAAWTRSAISRFALRWASRSSGPR